MATYEWAEPEEYKYDSLANRPLFHEAVDEFESRPDPEVDIDAYNEWLSEEADQRLAEEKEGI
jgi:hypothetical protein